MSVGFGLTAIATTAWQLALAVVIWTIGEMMNSPLMSAVVSDLAPRRLRAGYMGAYGLCFSAAILIGAPLGGLVLHRLGRAYVWGGSAVAGLMAATAFWGVRNRVARAGAKGNE